MAQLRVLPYILPSSENIRTVNWQQQTEGENTSLQEILPHWDPDTILQLSATIEVNTDEIRNECHLTPNDTLRAVILWHSPGTNLRGRGSYVDLNKTNSALPITLTLTLPGSLIADRVHVEAQIILAGFGNSSFKLSPRRPGSILWREKKTVILEGLASRFPMELIDFAESSWLPADAAWFLEWDDNDLDQMALKGLRLLINARNTRVKRALLGSHDIDKIIREIILFDVGRAIIITVLENNVFRQTPSSYADGSIGFYAYRLIRTLFPNESWAGIVNLYSQNRSHFDSELQARFQLFKEDT